MRDIYKNPMFYYVLAPVLLSLWPLLVWGRYLPTARESLTEDRQQYMDAEILISEILTMDPELLDTGEGPSMGKFTYPDAVDREANLCSIPSGKCHLHTDRITESGGKKVQRARVQLEDVSIVEAASFLSRILSRWVNLTCDGVKLSKKAGMPDQWDVDLKFKYDY